MRAYSLVALAAGLWGTLGLFYRILHDHYQFSALTLAFFRAGIAAILLLIGTAMIRPTLLTVSRRAIAFYLVYGLVGVAAFYFLYIQAVLATSVTTAVVLLYTAPAFVTLIAWRAWNEPLTRRKLISLLLAFAGCALVAGAYDPGRLVLNSTGVAIGLGAGLTYALYTVLSKFVLSRQSNLTAMTYGLSFGTLFLAPLLITEDLTPLSGGIIPWLLLIGLAVGPTLGSLALYNSGLKAVPAGNASLVAMLEPVVASFLALLFLGERLEVLQLIGAAMVMGGAALVNLE